MLERMMMVNVIAISLLAVSVAFGGGGNTKVSTSEASPGFILAAEDQLSATAAAVAGVAQDTKKAAMGTTEEEGWANAKIPRELICDSYGSCKHKLSAAFTKAKYMVTETAQEFEEGVKEAAEVAADKAKEMASKATRLSREDKTKEEIKSHGATSPTLRKLLDSFTRMVHLLGFATAYGMAMWVTFGMSHVLGRALPREQFALVQTRVYPLYFKAMASSLGLSLTGHSLWHRNHHSVTTKLQECNLLGLIAMVLANLLYLEPRASKAMFWRMKREKEEGRVAETAATTQEVAAGEDDTETEKLRTTLRKLNSYSSLLNVITLMGLTWHLLYLSQRLCRD